MQKFLNPITNYKVIETHETFITDTTTFKLVVWFNAKQSGIPYTIVEKQYNKNRKYIESYDYIYTKEGKTLTRHDLALEKLRLFYRDHRQNIISAQLFWNDLVNKKQHRIGMMYRNAERNEVRKPIFTECSDTGNVLCETIEGFPLKTFELINKTIEFTKSVSTRILLK